MRDRRRPLLRARPGPCSRLGSGTTFPSEHHGACGTSTTEARSQYRNPPRNGVSVPRRKGTRVRPRSIALLIALSVFLLALGLLHEPAPEVDRGPGSPSDGSYASDRSSMSPSPDTTPPGSTRADFAPDDTPDSSADRSAVTGLVALHGRVVDVEGAPIPDVSITLDIPPTTDDASVVDAETCTGLDGKFTLEGRRQGAVCPLIVEHPEYVAVRVLRWVGAEPEDIVLSRGQTVHGRVVDENERSVAGAIVRSSHSTQPASHLQIEPGRHDPAALDPEVATAEDGTFELVRIPDGPFSLHAVHPYRGASRRVSLEGGADDVLLEILAFATVEGTVVDDRGVPIAGATVRTVTVSIQGRGEESVTNSSGLFRLEGIPWETRSLTASAPSFPTLTRHIPEELAPGREVRGMRIRLPRGAYFEGRVVDESGDPIINAHVSDIFLGGQQDTANHRTEDDGRFRIGPLTSATGPGRLHTVLVRHPDFEAASIPNLVLPPGTSYELGTIVLRRALRLRGRVVTVDGTPVPSARVAIVRTEEHSLAPMTMADESGVFVLTLDAEDRDYPFRVEAATPGYLARRSVLIDASTDPLDGIELALSPGASISGCVEDPSGCPVASVTVSAGGPHSRGTTVTGEDGTFEIRGLDEGLHRMTVTAPGWNAVDDGPVFAEAGETDVRLVVDSPGTIEGWVVDTVNGVPVAQFSFAMARGIRPSGGRTDTLSGDGSFSLAGVPAGSWTLLVSADGYVQWSETCEVAGGETTEVTVELVPAATLTGTVVDDRSRPLGGVRVRCTERSTNRLPRDVITETDGLFTVEDLRPGTYDLAIEGGGMLTGRVTSIRIAPGVPVRLGSIRLGRGATISGSIRLADGSRPAWANVRVESTDGSVEHLASVEVSAMEYTVHGVPPGTYRLHVAAPGEGGTVRSASGPFRVEGEAELRRDVTVGRD